MQKKIFLTIASLSLLTIGLVILIPGKKDKSDLERLYIGKIVQIQGDFQDTGKVVDYRENEFILIESFEQPSSTPTLHRLSGKYSIKVIADNPADYIKKMARDKKNIPAKAESGQAESAETDADRQSRQPESADEKNEREAIPGPDNQPADGQPEETGVSETANQMDEIRENGKVSFDREMSEVAGLVREWGSLKKRYAEVCAGQYVRGEVNVQDESGQQVQPNDVLIEKESTPECQQIRGDMENLRENIRQRMAYALDNARRDGVYPGDIRRIREQYHLDNSDWE